MTVRLSKIEDFIWRKIGDEIVLIGNDGLSLHVLNKTAAHIWEICDGTNGPDEIIGNICERFEVSTEEASADVRTTLKKMEEAGFIRSTMEVVGE